MIKPVLKANGLKWKGWHAYRRGLATNLHELGIPDKVIQAILRHEDVKTTQRSYIKTLPSVVTEAMKRLEQRIACAADVQQVSVKLIAKLLKVWSRGRELNSRPADYEMSCFAVSRWFLLSAVLSLSLPFAPFLRANLQRILQREM